MSELTREKIYKKELEKVGGEGNNNLERIRSLAGGGSAFEDIKDSNGNYRFIQGNGTPETLNKFNFTYCKWSLSGTHLMVVLAGNVEASGSAVAGQLFCSFELPEWIMNKIYPVNEYGLLEIKNMYYFYNSSSTSTISKQQLFRKEDNKLTITNNNGGQFDQDMSFRIQFDLLIDAE